MPIRIAAICGSARPGNFTRKAMDLVLDELAAHLDVEVTPVYLEDLDLPMPGRPPADPEAVTALQQAIESSTGVILASPEYHGGVSSPMKLAIDNLGFPSKLAGKPIALLGVAAGGIGAIKSLEQLRGVCSHIGALVLPQAVSVARVHQVFDDQGRCVDSAVEQMVRGAGRDLVDYIRRVVRPDVIPADPTRPASASTHATLDEARAEFETAWANPSNTRVEPEAVNVNRLLQDARVDDFRLTGAMLWDAEVAKAWDPGTYIPGVVLEGESWGRQALATGQPWFVRSSRQVAWKEGVDPGIVLEEVYLDPSRRAVLFFGRAELVGPDGHRVESGSHQPLFHVEHAVAGTEEEPLNRWRIVHLTESVDPELVERHAGEGATGWLLGFLETFIDRELGRTLSQNASGH